MCPVTRTERPARRTASTVRRYGAPMGPTILLVGRVAAETSGVRGESIAGGRRYFESIAQAGGVPLMLPPIISLISDLPAVLRRVDGVVLHGGGDVDPCRYGQQRSSDALYGVVPEHDDVEFALVREALDIDLPMLAICRGMQVVNVALGGTLRSPPGVGARGVAPRGSHWRHGRRCRALRSSPGHRHRGCRSVGDRADGRRLHPRR
jgi:gamma-glutamyl-gamma-aminobutyrate hydrolase PuuD